MAFTFFFRDMHTIDNMVNILVPEVSGRSRIRVWDAGCAMGPEPYTLAMILAEAMGHFSFKNLYITATDIDEQDVFGKIILEGVYSDEETKRIPPEIFEKYFEALPTTPPTFKILDLIRERIQFQKHNLLSLQSIGSGFSLILCKNVLLHFQPAERIEVIKMFHASLATGGLLATENTQKLPAELSPLFTQVIPDVQLFRKTEDVS
jgi:chemotaxis protein methyltransferase CheR